MRTFNLLFFLNAYSDQNPSNSPSQGNFKWTRPINGLQVENAESDTIDLAPGESRDLFDKSRGTSQDGTTRYSLTLKPFTTNTYVLSYASGTSPNFRVQRSIGIDATTQVTVTQNGPVSTYTSPAGTPFSLGTVVVGDYVQIGNLFNTLNQTIQGVFQVISVTGSSFSVRNDQGVNEGPITLAAGFASQVSIFGSAGVQIGDTLNISSGFSPVTFGSYPVTAVYANSLEFFFAGVLPLESNILTEVALYESAISFLYLEVDEPISLIINGVAAGTVRPFVQDSSTLPGVFVRTDTIYSLSIQNASQNPASLWMALVG
jgi:hypothetical protein